MALQSDGNSHRQGRSGGDYTLMARILLIHPGLGRLRGFDGLACVEPLGLECLAGALEGHELRLVDLRLRARRARLDDEVTSFQPDVCALTCSFTTGVRATLDVAKRLRRLAPQALIVIGGMHPTVSPRDFSCPAVDVIARGEGEITVRDLVDTVARGGDLRDVPGLVLNTEDGQVSTGRRAPVADLDTLPRPHRHLAGARPRSYYFNFWRPLALVETARGCPHRCSFCSVWRFYRGKTRLKSVERVLNELDAVEAEYVLFTDDNFLTDVDRSRRIAEGLLAAGRRKTFSFQARADTLAAHPEILDVWVEAGLGHIFVGFEAVSEEQLAALRKASGLSEAERALAVLRRHPQLAVTGAFIVDPDFTREDFDRLREYVRRNGISHPQFSVLTPLPGTRLFREKAGELVTREYELYDLAHAVLPTRLSVEEFYQEFARLYRAAYPPARLPFGSLGRLIRGLVSGRYTFGQVRSVLGTIRQLADADTYLRGHTSISGQYDSEGCPA